jgi:quercetin 2,3-dioxygenase
MKASRQVLRVWKSRPTIEGAGVSLKRAFGFSEVPDLDPFLLLDDFRNTDPARYLPGFPWHPHRGIETITYVLHGSVEHGDSMGNRGVISVGDVQWMTAGSGIIHQEMPKGDAKGRMGGFQLWANLPRADKMMNPRYRDVKQIQMPVVTDASGATIKAICGRVGHTTGPVRDIVTDPEYLDVTVPPHSTFTRAVKEGHTVFAYVIEGRAFFDHARGTFAHRVTGANYFDFKHECMFGPENLVVYERKGDPIEVTTQEDSVRFLLVSGQPIGEPVAWYGPIVMNTQEELRIAFDEYERGTFIKHTHPRP